MNQLNQEIRKLEEKILDKELKLNKFQKNYEIQLLNEVNLLEKEYKENKNSELSTIQKREIKSLEKPVLKEQLEFIEFEKIEIQKLKIELRFLEREFKINLNSI